MSLGADLTRVAIGLLMGMILPRLPLLFFTRFLILERDIPPHPDPIPISLPLIQRLLLMRRIHLMGWLVAIFPLCLGIMVLKTSPQPFAFGLVAGVAWFTLTRLLPLHGGQGFGLLPLSKIKQINNLREPETECCSKSELQWEIRAIRCKNCRDVTMNSPRPDLGRIRCDGRILGSFRILLMDGNSAFPPTDDSVIGQRVELFGKVAEEE